jgi:hypothetical protein
MPYLNGLASANGVATQYYAHAHPSLPNYFELTVGEGTSITGIEGDSYNGVVTQDKVVRALTGAGKTWKCYAESLLAIGYLGGDSGAYLQHHDPFVCPAAMATCTDPQKLAAADQWLFTNIGYRTGHDGILQIARTEPAQLRHSFSTPRR